MGGLRRPSNNPYINTTTHTSNQQCRNKFAFWISSIFPRLGLLKMIEVTDNVHPTGSEGV